MKRFSLIVLSLLPFFSQAQEELQTRTSYFSNALFNTLLIIIVVLAIMVMALSSALKNIVSSDMFLEKIRKDKEQKPGSLNSLFFISGFLLLTYSASANETLVQNIKDDRIGGLDQFTFYLMLLVIFLELIVLAILFRTFKSILGVQKKKTAKLVEAKKTKTILDSLNGTVDIEDEDSILLDHDYDGIKELDNNLPPWWKYGFYLTIVVSVIYLINYHVTKTAPLQAEEYKNSLRKAENEIAEYMKNSADNVDESTVKLLTDASDISSGKDIFISNCAACHGKFGEGTVGPNLTDAYWLHGGSVKDIFKTIKYGWPDKGMKSWKEDFSPIQIAQLTSFIRSLKDSNPQKAKEKQGDLYEEKMNSSDSSAVKADTLKLAAPELN